MPSQAERTKGLAVKQEKKGDSSPSTLPNGSGSNPGATLKKQGQDKKLTTVQDHIPREKWFYSKLSSIEGYIAEAKEKIANLDNQSWVQEEIKSFEGGIKHLQRMIRGSEAAYAEQKANLNPRTTSNKGENFTEDSLKQRIEDLDERIGTNQKEIAQLKNPQWRKNEIETARHDLLSEKRHLAIVQRDFDNSPHPAVIVNEVLSEAGQKPAEDSKAHTEEEARNKRLDAFLEDDDDIGPFEVSSTTDAVPVLVANIDEALIESDSDHNQAQTTLNRAAAFLERAKTDHSQGDATPAVEEEHRLLANKVSGFQGWTFNFSPWASQVGSYLDKRFSQFEHAPGFLFERIIPQGVAALTAPFNKYLAAPVGDYVVTPGVAFVKRCLTRVVARRQSYDSVPPSTGPQNEAIVQSTSTEEETSAVETVTPIQTTKRRQRPKLSASAKSTVILDLKDPSSDAKQEAKIALCPQFDEFNGAFKEACKDAWLRAVNRQPGILTEVEYRSKMMMNKDRVARIEYLASPESKQQQKYSTYLRKAASSKYSFNLETARFTQDQIILDVKLSSSSKPVDKSEAKAEVIRTSELTYQHELHVEITAAGIDITFASNNPPEPEQIAELVCMLMESAFKPKNSKMKLAECLVDFSFYMLNFASREDTMGTHVDADDEQNREFMKALIEQINNDPKLTRIKDGSPCLHKIVQHVAEESEEEQDDAPISDLPEATSVDPSIATTVSSDCASDVILGDAKKDVSPKPSEAKQSTVNAVNTVKPGNGASVLSQLCIAGLITINQAGKLDEVQRQAVENSPLRLQKIGDKYKLVAEGAPVLQKYLDEKHLPVLSAYILGDTQNQNLNSVTLRELFEDKLMKFVEVLTLLPYRRELLENNEDLLNQLMAGEINLNDLPSSKEDVSKVDPVVRTLDMGNGVAIVEKKAVANDKINGEGQPNGEKAITRPALEAFKAKGTVANGPLLAAAVKSPAQQATTVKEADLVAPTVPEISSADTNGSAAKVPTSSTGPTLSFKALNGPSSK